MTTLCLFGGPFKISLNSSEYFVRLVLAETFCKPLLWIATAFGIVATVYTMTKRNHVMHHGSRTFRQRQRYPVIGDYGMPQALRSTANRAAPLPILITSVLIGATKTIRQSPLARSTPILPKAGFCLVSLSVLDLMLMKVSPALIGTLTAILALLFCVSGFPCFASFSAYITMAFVILLAVIPSVFRMFFSPLARLCPMTFSVTCVVISGAIAAALLTFCSQSRGVACHAMKIFRRSRVYGAAFCAALGRGIHSVSLSLNLRLLSAGGEIDRFSGATLADFSNYTTERSI